jgi:hypothetical protein
MRLAKAYAIFAFAVFILGAVLLQGSGAASNRQRGLLMPVAGVSAQTAGPHCSDTPLGALPPAKPTWCSPTATGNPTFVSQGPSWVDDFNHGLANAALGPGYREFSFGSIERAQHFRHANHWMLDLAGVDEDGPGPWNFGGAAMRPDRTFRFQNGTLVVEADVAAGIREYAGTAWPEIVVTTAPAPTEIRRDGTYVYEAYSGHWTLGCRLGAEGVITCALLDDTAGGDATARVWELSHFQCGNAGGSTYTGGCASSYGGHPSMVPGAMRFCVGSDPDLNCRDRFRWEISKDRLAWYVNGTLYMEHWDFPPNRQLPAALLDAELYIYFGSFLFKPDAPVVRFHWDRIAVNAAGAPAPQPTASPSQMPDPSPSASPAPGTSEMITFDDKAGAGQALDGQYPSGVIDWGTGEWYHAGPYGAFTTKSASFTSDRVRSSFTFLAPRLLLRLDAYNGGDSSTTISLTCAGQPERQVRLAAKEKATIETNWTGACTTVTVSSSNGWDTNFDTIVIESASSE